MLMSGFGCSSSSESGCSPLSQTSPSSCSSMIQSGASLSFVARYAMHAYTRATAE
jgi:hypothetical protein